MFQGPKRPNILLLRLARPRPPRPLRHVRNPNLVHARNRNPPHVRRPNGLRSPKPRLEAHPQRRETETDAWERLRDALFARTICGVLLAELEPVFAVQTYAQEADAQPYAVGYACEGFAVGTGVGECGVGFVE